MRASGVYWTLTDNSLRPSGGVSFGVVVPMMTLKGRVGELNRVTATDFEDKLGHDLSYNPNYLGLNKMLQQVSYLDVLRVNHGAACANVYDVAPLGLSTAPDIEQDMDLSTLGETFAIRSNIPGLWAGGQHIRIRETLGTFELAVPPAEEVEIAPAVTRDEYTVAIPAVGVDAQVDFGGVPYVAVIKDDAATVLAVLQTDGNVYPVSVGTLAVSATPCGTFAGTIMRIYKGHLDLDGKTVLLSWFDPAVASTSRTYHIALPTELVTETFNFKGTAYKAGIFGAGNVLVALVASDGSVLRVEGDVLGAAVGTVVGLDMTINADLWTIADTTLAVYTVSDLQKRVMLDKAVPAAAGYMFAGELRKAVVFADNVSADVVAVVNADNNLYAVTYGTPGDLSTATVGTDVSGFLSGGYIVDDGDLLTTACVVAVESSAAVVTAVSPDAATDSVLTLPAPLSARYAPYTVGAASYCGVIKDNVGTILFAFDGTGAYAVTYGTAGDVSTAVAGADVLGTVADTSWSYVTADVTVPADAVLHMYGTATPTIIPEADYPEGTPDSVTVPVVTVVSTPVGVVDADVAQGDAATVTLTPAVIKPFVTITLPFNLDNLPHVEVDGVGYVASLLVSETAAEPSLVIDSRGAVCEVKAGVVDAAVPVGTCTKDTLTLDPALFTIPGTHLYLHTRDGEKKEYTVEYAVKNGVVYNVLEEGVFTLVPGTDDYWENKEFDNFTLYLKDDGTEPNFSYFEDFIALDGGSNGASPVASQLPLGVLGKADADIVVLNGLSQDLGVINAFATTCESLYKSLFIGAPNFANYAAVADWAKGLYATEYSQLAWVWDNEVTEIGNVAIDPSVSLMLIYANMWNRYSSLNYPPAGATYGTVSITKLTDTDAELYADDLKTNKINWQRVIPSGAVMWEQRTRYALESDLTYANTVFILRELRTRVLTFAQDFNFRYSTASDLTLLEVGLREILESMRTSNFLVQYTLIMPTFLEAQAAGRTLTIKIGVSVISDAEEIIFDVVLNRTTAA